MYTIYTNKTAHHHTKCFSRPLRTWPSDGFFPLPVKVIPTALRLPCGKQSQEFRASTVPNQGPTGADRHTHIGMSPLSPRSITYPNIGNPTHAPPTGALTSNGRAEKARSSRPLPATQPGFRKGVNPDPISTGRNTMGRPHRGEGLAGTFQPLPARFEIFLQRPPAHF